MDQENQNKASEPVPSFPQQEVTEQSKGKIILTKTDNKVRRSEPSMSKIKQQLNPMSTTKSSKVSKRNSSRSRSPSLWTRRTKSPPRNKLTTMYSNLLKLGQLTIRILHKRFYWNQQKCHQLHSLHSIPRIHWRSGDQHQSQRRSSELVWDAQRKIPTQSHCSVQRVKI